MKKPEISFVEIDMNDSVITGSVPSCSNCATDGGRYTGGGQICFGDMTVSTTCTDSMSIALGDGFVGTGDASSAVPAGDTAAVSESNVMNFIPGFRQ